MNAVLDFDHISKSYDKTPVLKDITASIQCGEVIGLLGLNGAGKDSCTSVLRCHVYAL